MIRIPCLKRSQVTLELLEGGHTHDAPFQFNNVDGMLGYKGQITAAAAFRQFPLPNTDVDFTKSSRIPEFSPTNASLRGSENSPVIAQDVSPKDPLESCSYQFP